MLTRARSAALVVLLSSSSWLSGCEGDYEEAEPSEQDSEAPDDTVVCIELCDPLKQSCGSGMTCVPDQPGFSCQSLPALAEGTHYGLHDACAVGSQTCDPGLVCLPVAVPGCGSGAGCCVEICDMDDPQCSDGTSCYPFFEAERMCYPNIGACVL